MKKAIGLGLVLLATTVTAGTINRSTKPGSTTSFCTSFSLGNTQQCADLDTDLDRLYSEINGSLSDANLAADSVGASELADNSVASANIIAGSILDSDVNASAAIAGTKLGVGAAVYQVVSAAFDTSEAVGATEEDVATLGSMTTRGGRVVLFGQPGATMTNISGSAQTVTLRLYRGAIEIAQWDYEVSDAISSGASPVILFSEVPAAGSYVYKVTVQTSNANMIWGTTSANTGTFFAMELR